MVSVDTGWVSKMSPSAPPPGAAPPPGNKETPGVSAAPQDQQGAAASSSAAPPRMKGAAEAVSQKVDGGVPSSEEMAGLPKRERGLAAHIMVTPPLTPEDGAARILDPIISAMNGQRIQTGCLLKHFEVVDW